MNYIAYEGQTGDETLVGALEEKLIQTFIQTAQKEGKMVDTSDTHVVVIRVDDRYVGAHMRFRQTNGAVMVKPTYIATQPGGVTFVDFLLMATRAQGDVKFTFDDAAQKEYERAQLGKYLN